MGEWLKRMSDKLATWYRGRYVPPPRDEGGPVFFVSLGHYEQPLLAKLLGILGTFWINHWKWIISAAIAVAAIVVRVSGG